MQEQAVVIECQNCHTKIPSWRDSNGIARGQCPKCGAVITQSLKSCRKMVTEMICPKGQRFY